MADQRQGFRSCYRGSRAALAPANMRPDVLIDRDGATAALRSDSGNLVFPPATAAGYSVDNWLLLTARSAMPKLRRKEPRSAATFLAARSEERRVGKECRYRWLAVQ